MERPKEPVLEEDNTCSICLELLYKPSKIPCGHYFCIQCLKDWFLKNRICPNCRSEIPEEYKPKVKIQIQFII